MQSFSITVGWVAAASSSALILPVLCGDLSYWWWCSAVILHGEWNCIESPPWTALWSHRMLLLIYYCIVTRSVICIHCVTEPCALILGVPVVSQLILNYAMPGIWQELWRWVCCLLCGKYRVVKLSIAFTSMFMVISTVKQGGYERQFFSLWLTKLPIHLCDIWGKFASYSNQRTVSHI